MVMKCIFDINASYSFSLFIIIYVLDFSHTRIVISEDKFNYLGFTWYLTVTSNCLVNTVEVMSVIFLILNVTASWWLLWILQASTSRDNFGSMNSTHNTKYRDSHLWVSSCFLSIFTHGVFMFSTNEWWGLWLHLKISTWRCFYQSDFVFVYLHYMAYEFF